MRNEVFSCTKTEGNGVFSVVPFRVVSSALVAPPMWIPCACSRAPAPPALAKLPAARACTPPVSAHAILKADSFSVKKVVQLIAT